MKQNLQLKRLPEDMFAIVDQLSSERGPIRFLDPSRHIGFDIFDEFSGLRGANIEGLVELRYGFGHHFSSDAVMADSPGVKDFMKVGHRKDHCSNHWAPG